MAKIVRLGRGVIRKIHGKIDEIFDNAKFRLLGPDAIRGKEIRIGFHHELSLPGLFEAGAREERVRPDEDVLNSLVRVANNYIDAVRERAKARIINEIDALIVEAKLKGGMDPQDFKDILNTKLVDIWGEVSNHIHMIVDTEVAKTKNVSVLEGIIQANAAMGIGDPSVYFVVVRDKDLCSECKRLHLQDDGVTPRVWKMSELGHGYHKKGQENPKIGGLHPHCRCTLVTLMPGYGFNNQGRVTYIKPGHDEYAAQNNLGKSEPLEKALPTRSLGAFYRDILQPFGWPDPAQESGKHKGVTHPVSGLNWMGYSHTDTKGDLPGQRQEYFLKQLGIKFVGSGGNYEFGYDPASPFAAGYAKIGAPSVETVRNRMVKRKAFRDALGSGSNPLLLDHIDSPESYVDVKDLEHGIGSEEIQNPNFQHRASQVDLSKLQPIPVMPLSTPGKYMVAENDEALHQAKAKGFTHVPVKAI